MNQKQIAFEIVNMCNDFEPKWKTHSMSRWNILRRHAHWLITGEILSSSLSWDSANEVWEL